MKLFITLLLSIVFFSSSYGQKERSLNRKGVKNYVSEDYNNAEVEFMKALEEDSTSFAANYNRAATLYKLEKYQEANEIFASLAENMDASVHLSDLMHNLGNNLMKQEMYEQSIEAYKNSLRLRSDDEDSRYNLAYAQAKLKQQQEENKDQDKDKDKDKNKDDQENKDKNKDDQQDQDDQEQEEKEEDQDDKKQNEDEEKEDQEKQQQEQTKEMTQEDINRILQAIQEQEKDVKEKVEKQKAKAQKVKTEKDW